MLIKSLSKNKRRTDASVCLVRHTVAHPSSFWGDRSISKHLESIWVTNDSRIVSEEVLLIDDIVTTGNSLTACKKLLLDRGAADVVCLALGVTKKR